MEFKIEKLDELRVIGIKNVVHFEKQTHEDIPSFWSDVINCGLMNKLIEVNDGVLTGTVGVLANYVEDKQMDYYVGVCSSKNIDNLEEIIIEPSYYAVFECKMSELRKTWDYILEQWQMDTDLKLSSAPSIEYYPNQDECKIYMAIIK